MFNLSYPEIKGNFLLYYFLTDNCLNLFKIQPSKFGDAHLVFKKRYSGNQSTFRQISENEKRITACNVAILFIINVPGYRPEFIPRMRGRNDKLFDFISFRSRWFGQLELLHQARKDHQWWKAPRNPCRQRFCAWCCVKFFLILFSAEL